MQFRVSDKVDLLQESSEMNCCCPNLVAANLPLVRALKTPGTMSAKRAVWRWQWTGDPELVIRSLTRIHTLNTSLHRLKLSDEVLQNYPSLEHRLEAIRSCAVPSYIGIDSLENKGTPLRVDIRKRGGSQAG